MENITGYTLEIGEWMHIREYAQPLHRFTFSQELQFNKKYIFAHWRIKCKRGTATQKNVQYM